MEPIEFYFEKYHSDKGANGYSNVYNDIFTPRRNDHISLLEIGVGTLNPTHSNMLFWKEKYPEYQPGASLRAFRDYFPGGVIRGVDIQNDCLIVEDRICVHLLNSTDKIECDNHFNGITFDFVIDDGDHNYLSQIRTFENFFGKMNRNGIYVIEDLESPNELVDYFIHTIHNYTLHECGPINKMITIRK